MTYKNSIQESINTIESKWSNDWNIKDTDSIFQWKGQLSKDILQYNLPPYIKQAFYIANQVFEIFANEEVKKQQQEQEKNLILKEKLEKIKALPKEKKITEFMLAYLYWNEYKLQYEGFSASNNGIKINKTWWPCDIKMDISFTDPLNMNSYEITSYYQSCFNEGRGEDIKTSISRKDWIDQLARTITEILSKKIQSL